MIFSNKMATRSLIFIITRPILYFSREADLPIAYHVICHSPVEPRLLGAALQFHHVTNIRGPVDETVVRYSDRDGVSIFGFGSRARSCSTCISVQYVRASEEEDVGEARSAGERGACIVAGPLLSLSQRRGRPGHIGTAYQTDPSVEGLGQRRPASPMILHLFFLLHWRVLALRVMRIGSLSAVRAALIHLAALVSRHDDYMQLSAYANKINSMLSSEYRCTR